MTLPNPEIQASEKALNWSKKTVSSVYTSLKSQMQNLPLPFLFRIPQAYKPHEPASAKAAKTQRAGSIKAMKTSSLLWLSLGLMILGTCFFFAGFFCGIWFEAKPAVDSTVSSSLSSVSVPRHIPHSKSSIMHTLERDATGAVSHAAHSQAASNTHAAAATGTQTTHPSTTPGSTSTHAAAPATSQAGKGTYSIELGAFATSANALDLQKKLKAQHITTHIMEKADRQGAPLFSVRTGKFASYNAAFIYARNLSKVQQFSAVVVPIISTK